MKAIVYSIFGKPDSFEFNFYLRGLYFNARMNHLLYPDWRTVIVYDYNLPTEPVDFIWALAVKTNSILCAMPHESLCKSMLWRTIPVFKSLEVDGQVFNITHVLSRDTDAITTYREAQAVQEWVDSGLGFHGITDNPAHTLPMMGGLTGFKVDHFKQTFPEYDTFEKLVANFDLSKHGSDQQLLMKRIYPKAKGDMMGHFFEGCHEEVKIVRHSAKGIMPGTDYNLWESNLTCRHIGSPGVVDMEVLRFFQRFDKTDYSSFENEFKDICYWRQ